ncbi:DUF3237 domain-containing protein [Streptomyces sp. NBC_00582]|uniref:DUF3237 domain-containing protein n=1 Tax=Streptomyces sp. NBC_00582 TaxID=2975783 RepID=UPI002E81EC6B|nr:DUF3237 domain-containing protein [Streptomyces sp. NBC_00582]WUB66055.1 DUF3237 domain-containing protein [Streptomyces sp. NBC_00582]
MGQQPELRFLFDMTVTMGEGIDLGRTPYGEIAFQHAIGGTVSGPRVQGEVLPVGGDKVVGRTDGTRELNVQAIIKTTDDHHILMSYRGLVRPMQSADGKPGVYWRTAPLFETAAEPYQWLNGVLAVGHGTFGDGQVNYQIHEVL